ncbi:hypothetical protein GTY67_34500 [Streptomyces sp. SID8374]|uniref:hypothetical protein n=1 Tax=Streptomyces sp. SID8374 TaxID=2690354 RepID=UPI00136EF96C|nr:hypothetical protein [Streptomyces sp. SID8374]MYX18460.1 hypothetical protein [Streptomyces sp. SID8374]
MTELLPLCEARTALSPIETIFLTSLPEPAHELVETPRCELHDDHPGVHMALAQESAKDSWWLVWAPGNAQLIARGQKIDRRLHEMDNCPAVEEGGAEDECLLAVRHPGAHSFEMETSGSREPSAFYRKKMLAALREDLDDKARADLEEMESLLSVSGDPLPLITEDEALVIAMLLGQAAQSDWLVEELVLQLAERMESRLDALAR